MMTFEEFKQWESASRDTIDVKRVYVDMAGGLVAGVVLSQIVFYYLPRKDGKSRLRVRKGGDLWLAIKRDDWWDQVRLDAKQFDRALRVLIDKGLVQKKTFKFKGVPILHVRLLEDAFLKSLFATLQRAEKQLEGQKRESPLSQNGKVNLPDSGKSTNIEDEHRDVPNGTVGDVPDEAQEVNAAESQPVHQNNKLAPPARTRAPQPNDVIFDALLETLWSDVPSGGVGSDGGRVGAAIRAIKEYEVGQGRSPTPEELADKVRRFWDWYKRKNPGFYPKRADTIREEWAKFDAVKPPAPPKKLTLSPEEEKPWLLTGETQDEYYARRAREQEEKRKRQVLEDLRNRGVDVSKYEND
jgi:hypothetical protein